jgi:hypothetical protein
MASTVKGSLVLWGKIDTTSTDEDALNDWWTNEHLPERLQLPGFKRARRYHTPLLEGGTRNYLAWYEVSEIEDLASPAYMHALNNPTEKTKQFMPYLARMNRSACSKVYTTIFDERPITNLLLCLEFGLRKPLTASNCQQLASSIDHFPKISNFTCLLRNEGLTASGSNSSSYKGVQFETARMEGAANHKHIILVELALGDNNSSDTHSSLGKFLQEQITALGAENISLESYQLLCTMGGL